MPHQQERRRIDSADDRESVRLAGFADELELHHQSPSLFRKITQSTNVAK
jgi:demethoxyubiquinone hydroxylase (CLK1/Coq7/Cat5 family)